MSSISQISPSFDYQNFSLVEAIYYTVANQTNIKIEQTQVNIQEKKVKEIEDQIDLYSDIQSPYSAPVSGELSDAQLTTVAGGKSHHYHGSAKVNTNVYANSEAVSDTVTASGAAAAVDAAPAAVAVVVLT